jgi:hypothetical protein
MSRRRRSKPNHEPDANASKKIPDMTISERTRASNTGDRTGGAQDYRGREVHPDDVEDRLERAR